MTDPRRPQGRLTRRRFLEAAGGAAALAAAPWIAAAAEETVSEAAAAPGRDAFARLDAHAQAELVRRGEVRPRELVEAAIRRLEALEPVLNTLVSPDFERALARADGAPAGPFTGVPYLVKDLTDYAGLPTRYGSRLFQDAPPAQATHPLVRRAEAAGLVVLGKSNTPEFGLLPVTRPVAFGPTRNPWSLSHDPGGSSGGAAAAVAAGIVPVAQASDGGGSIRIPASNCGLFGLKTSRGRQPEPYEMVGDLAVRHCVSRSVRDSARLLQATAEPEAPGPAVRLPPPLPEPGEPRRLRIALAVEDVYGSTPHAECAAAVRSAAQLCESLGHVVEEARPEIDGDAFRTHFLTLWCHDPAKLVREVAQATGSPPPEEALEGFTWGCARRYESLPEGALAAALAFMDEMARAAARFHETYDVWLTPVLAQPPVETGSIDPNGAFEETLDRVVAYVPYTPFANAVGAPAMSVPLHWTPSGLPVGSHFQGRMGEEATLLALAYQLEEARPWAQRWPPRAAG